MEDQTSTNEFVVEDHPSALEFIEEDQSSVHVFVMEDQPSGEINAMCKSQPKTYRHVFSINH